MSSGSTEAARLELPALLSTATLRLAPNVTTVQARAHLLVLKEPAGGRYLFVEPEHWQLLKRFTNGATVPKVLCEIITENRCPPLRDFYELAVKSYQQGFLQADGEPKPTPLAPVRWWASLPGPMARAVAGLGLAYGVAVLVSTRVQMPVHEYHLIFGWALACVAGSISQVLAACTLAGAGCAVYRPRFDWKTPAPRFRVDLDDAVMGGRDTEANVALVRLAAPFLFAAFAALRAPEYFLPLLVSVFLHLSPLWKSPVLDLLRVSFGNPQLATYTGFARASRRPFALLSQARLRLADRKFLLARAVVTAAWLALVFVTGCILFQASAVDLLLRFRASGGLHYTGIVVLAALGAVVVSIVGYVLWLILTKVVNWWRERLERGRRMSVTVTSPESVAGLLAGTVLFRDLPPAVLQEVAAAMKPEQHARGDYVIRVGESADRLYVVVTGRLEVVRHFGDDKAMAVAEMLPGDVVGEMGVIRSEPRSRSIRSATRSLLLTLEKADFERLVLAHIPRTAVEDAVQKVGFLQNIDLVKDWSQQSLAAFARLSKIQEYNPGDVVMREGEDNLFLYLVHRGEFEVTQDGKRLRRLKQGDTFGEVGMLQNNASTAGVTATTPGSCLVVSKADFLRFITQDFNISLQFEEIGTKRLGQQVFGSNKGPGFNMMRG